MSLSVPSSANAANAPRECSGLSPAKNWGELHSCVTLIGNHPRYWKLREELSNEKFDAFKNAERYLLFLLTELERHDTNEPLPHEAFFAARHVVNTLEQPNPFVSFVRTSIAAIRNFASRGANRMSRRETPAAEAD